MRMSTYVATRPLGAPGGTEWPGGDVGAHTHEVLSELLGMSDEDIANL